MSRKSFVTDYLEKSNKTVFVFFTIIAAFTTYSCMYAFRKPLAAATFDGLQLWGMDFKSLALIAQVVGYALSKFLGIKFVSEMTPNKRVLAILLMILIAGVALLLFGLIPYPWNLAAIFLNGLPLGMVWGLVFSFLEGRRFTEILGAGLSVSFIFSSGFVKSAGKFVMSEMGVSQFFMPVVTGAMFLVPLAASLWMLSKIPEPSPDDIKLRTKREPMSGSDRKKFFLDFAFGLVILTIAYTFLTIIRDFRDNFAAEIWQATGYGDSTEIFTLTEIPVSVFILLVLGATFVIKSNFRALIASHLFVIFGVVLCFGATYIYFAGSISAPLWMILTGTGLYVGYVPFNTMFFDRLIAAFRHAGNVGFLIYLVDSFGYMGSVGILFYKNFGYSGVSWLEFFKYIVNIGSVLIIVLMAISIVYFVKKYSREKYGQIDSQA